MVFTPKRSMCSSCSCREPWKRLPPMKPTRRCVGVLITVRRSALTEEVSFVQDRWSCGDRLPSLQEGQGEETDCGEVRSGHVPRPDLQRPHHRPGRGQAAES